MNFLGCYTKSGLLKFNYTSFLITPIKICFFFSLSFPFLSIHFNYQGSPSWKLCPSQNKRIISPQYFQHFPSHPPLLCAREYKIKLHVKEDDYSQNQEIWNSQNSFREYNESFLLQNLNKSYDKIENASVNYSNW